MLHTSQVFVGQGWEYLWAFRVPLGVDVAHKRPSSLTQHHCVFTQETLSDLKLKKENPQTGYMTLSQTMGDIIAFPILQH